jgi:hypothetical protein
MRFNEFKRYGFKRQIFFSCNLVLTGKNSVAFYMRFNEFKTSFFFIWVV